MALIRYPGSKAKLVREIMNWFPQEVYGALYNNKASYEYREPFFGAGAVGFAVLGKLPKHCSVWINDKDPAMVALWMTVENNPIEFQARIGEFKPCHKLFYKFKEEDGRLDLTTTEIALRKLALHRMSYSGLGYMSGGPLGGKNQSSEYNVDCRWNAAAMKEDVAKLHKLFRRFAEVRITSLDFSKLLDGAPADSFVYLDPPYYEKGPQLYRYAMDAEDHNVLAIMLRDCRAEWVLSYDDHPEIRRLYSWATIRPVEIRYVMARATSATRPKNQEIIIRPATSG